MSVRQSQPVIAASPSARLDTMAETLAIAVRTPWDAEEHVRRVHDPFPLPARWTNAPDELVDHWPKINSDPRGSDRLLMIRCPEEYADAVRGAAGVLNAAAVVELEGLVIDDLAEYLPLTQRKGGVHNGQWGQVLDRLRANPDAPLAKALSTPLMVALARTIFSDTEADPAELLDIRSRAELEARLLAGFVPAVYSDLPAAHRWLTFLADHLRQSDTHDLAWRGFA